MYGHTQCPACGGLSTHVTKGEFKASSFQAFGNRVCDQCGTAWRPRCPRWAAPLCLSSRVARCWRPFRRLLVAFSSASSPSQFWRRETQRTSVVWPFHGDGFVVGQGALLILTFVLTLGVFALAP